MSFKYCHQVKEDGILCQSAAVRGRDYCYFHLRHRARRLAMAQAKARGQRWQLKLPPLEDLHAVQSGLMQVLDALATDTIDPRRAALMLYGLQQAASNVRSVTGWMGNSRFHVSRQNQMRADTYPGLEREFDLPKGTDMDTPPEIAFPPPAPAEQPAVPLAAAPLDFEITPLDIELNEIGDREGAAGVARRLKEISAGEDRKLRQKRKQLEHARRLLQAAARNAEWVGRVQAKIPWPPPEPEQEPYDFATVVRESQPFDDGGDEVGLKKPPLGEEKAAKRAGKAS